MGGPGGNEAPPGVGMTTASSPAPPASMPTPTHMQTPRTANSPAPPAASSAPTPAANKQRAPWPGDKANPLTVLFLSWLDGLLWRGYRKPLQDEDIYAAPIKHSAKSVRARVEAFQTRHPSASFTSVIVRAFFLRWLAGFTSKVVFICAYLLQPFWVGALVMYIDDRLVGRYNESSTYFWGIHSGLHLAAGLTVTSLVAILCINLNFQHQTRYGTYLRTATLVFVYEKAMRLSPAARRRYTTGSILTMASCDAERIYQGVLTSQWVWAGPLVIMVAMGLTIKELGLASGLVGVGVMVLAMLYQAQSASKSGTEREALVKLTDERLKLTNEVLQGIRVVKLYNWERPIAEMIEAVRNQEIKALARMLTTKITAIVSLFLAPVVVSAAMFTAYFLLEKDGVSVERVFTALAFCNLIRLPMSSMPNAISNLSDMFVAVKRVDGFMTETELEQPAAAAATVPQEPRPQQQPLPPGAIRLEHASFSWDADGPVSTTTTGSGSEPPPAVTLRNVTLEIKSGQLVAVVGPVGAGKSSLVSALLGEIPCVAGSRRLGGRVSLVAQEAWIQNKTVREGILFGRPYDRARFRAVLKAAQLKTDLEMLSAGAHTEIGERGVSLSGGQKARVSLARALYEADADVFLLDDPLAAVDAHVSKALFDTAIAGVLHGKTRVLVLSSNYHLLSSADLVVVMEGGRVLGAGTYQELLPRFPKYFDNGSGSGNGGGGDSAQDELERSLALSPVPGPEQGGKNPPGRCAITFEELGKSARLDRTESVFPGNERAGALMEKEDRETGSVSSAIYVEYFSGATATRWGGALLGAFIVLVFGLAQGCRVMLDLWLTKMAETLSGEDVAGSGESTRSTSWWLGIYWAFAVLTVGLSIFRSHLVLWAAIRSCSNLHRRLLRGVLRAPVNLYFDCTPLGRIVNRFSRDVDQVDQGLPDTLLQLLQNSIFLLSILGLCVSSSPWFILLFLPILGLFYVLYSFFRQTSREVKRLEGVTRSPIYSSFTETLQGIVNIRAFQRSGDFIERHNAAIDANTSLFLLFWFSSRWLAIRLDMLSTGVIALLSFLGVVVADRGTEGGSAMFSPSLLGLSLIYGLQLTGLLQWTIRLTVEVENNFTAVERLVSFLKLPEEAPEATDIRLPADWPSAGAIEARDVKLAYRPGLPLVLKGLDLSIKGGEKIGICGRTGAGKSSLGQALFRLVELEGGAILIDGVDIKTLGLDDLRSRLTVIPQEPVLFSSTIRFNLDPFGHCTDHEIWEALRRVYLERDVQALPGKLDSPVLEGGSNLSVGQRQLVCICRALLRKTRILLMDEATAAVDSETDRKIQETIRRNFGHCTILTVAHRLGTIIDYNRIAVLDRGRCLEFDSPHRLLQKKEGAFAGLVAELGPEAAASLKEVARTAAASSWEGGAPVA